MKTFRIFFSLFVFPFFALAQVGIGTTSPNAQLEITSTNQSTPANTDGILIPKIDEFPAVNPTAAQNGMMVFATGSGSVAQGFYYWINGSGWQNISTGAESINELSDGRSDDDGSEDGSSVYIGRNSGQFDDLTDNRNVGFGYWAMLNVNTGFRNVAVGHSTMVLNTSGSTNTAIGSSTLRNIVSGNGNTAVGAGAASITNSDYNTSVGYESLRTNTSGTRNTALGFRAGYNNNGDNNVFLGTGAGNGPISNAISGSVFLGYQAGYNESTSNKLYIDNSNTATPLIYGDFSTNTLRANGTFQIGDPSGTGYALPNTDGAADQVLQSDGSGGVSWQTVNSGADSINQLNDGRSDNDGTEDGASLFLGINAGANDNFTENYNVGIGYSALMANTNGEWNTAIGYSTLINNTSSGNTAVGYNSLISNTTGVSNTVLGIQSLNDNTIGTDNIAIGAFTLDRNLDGNNNIGMGRRALNWNVSGSDNVAIGRSAGGWITGQGNTAIGAFTKSSAPASGDYNVFIGYYAGSFATGSNQLWIENSNSTTPLIYGEFDNDILRANGTFQVGDPSGTGYSLPPTDGAADQVLLTDGSGNVSWSDQTVGAQRINDLIDARSDNDGTNDGSSIYLGVDAGVNDDLTNNNNVGIGFGTLANNTSGYANTVVGAGGMNTNISGSGNSAFGNAALFSATTAISNTALGTAALYSTTDGELNVALGAGALYSNLSGTENVAIGNSSGLQNYGSENTFIGAHAGEGAGFTNTSGNVFIGYRAGMIETNSNRLHIHNNVTASPLIYGEFDNNFLRVNGTFQVNVPGGGSYTFPATDGTANQVLQTDGAGNLSWTNAPADNDWTAVGINIERQIGNVFIGDNATTGNDLYINDRMIDWDNVSYYVDPNGINRLHEVNLDGGSNSDPSVSFGDARTGFFRPGINMLGVTINNTERVRIGASGNVGINTTNPNYNLEIGGELMLEDTAVPTHTAGHSGIFSRTGELYAIDSAGNVTVISPHHFELTEASDPMAWSFYSENLDQNRKINVDMLKVVRTVEQLSGEHLVFAADLEGNTITSKDQAISLKQQVADQQIEIISLKAELKAIKKLLQQQE